MINLRSLTDLDSAEIRHWPAYPGDMEQMDYALREQGWLDEMRTKPDVALYAATDGEDLVGFSILARTGVAEAEFRIALRADKTGKRLGETISLLTLHKGFTELGLSRIHLIVRKSNCRGVRLYQRLGFTDCGECRKMIRGTEVDFLIMGKEMEKTVSKSMRSVLIIIDVQNDYFRGGRMELVGAEAAGLRAKEALAFFRGRNLPVVHIRHLSTRPTATFFLPDTSGIEIHSCVAPLPGEAVFIKNFPNSFRETPLLEHLRGLGIERLVLTGMMTSMCVDATARAAFDLGFQNVLLHDAMATRDLGFGGTTIPAAQVHGAFLAALGSVYGRVTSVAEFLVE